ncbi:MAG: hypothetical protein JO307_06720 [Bryobacterales bacterium]|nr:hypothetical protein [Bryobacterales bacterium]MBV9398120.1 hypothetical protein [Bryobacterales bacterium]
MDASTLLGRVAEAYANLKSLSADILTITESGDEASRSRSEQRSKAYFVAPDKIRIEQGGSHESLFVCDGVVLQTFFAPIKRHSRVNVHEGSFLPGFFRPDHPLLGGPPDFLFHHVNERVASAEMLPEPATGIQALSVSYEPSPYPQLVSGSPVTYWVDSGTHLIVRAEGKISHRRPASDEISTQNKVLSFDLKPGAAVAPATFEYAPPADAISGPGGRAGGGGSAGGGHMIRTGRNRGNWMESRNSHEWDGEILIERYNLRIHGMDLMFERRITFSDDRKEVRISERIAGPSGEAHGDFLLPLA